MHELEDPHLGQDPANIELIIQRMGAGTVDADGSNAFESDVNAIVPGGTLPLTGSYARSAPESTNGEGSSTAPYGAALSCDTYGLSGCGVTTIIQ